MQPSRRLSEFIDRHLGALLSSVSWVSCVSSRTSANKNTGCTVQKGVGHAAGLERKYFLPRLFVLLITVVYRY